MRGLLAEFGIVLPQGVFALERGVPEILADAENSLSDRVRERFSQLFGQLRALGATVREWEHEILAWHRDNPSSRRLEKIPGIGPLGASALVASTGDIRTFKSGRQHGGQQRQPVSQSSVIDTRTRGEGDLWSSPSSDTYCSPSLLCRFWRSAGSPQAVSSFRHAHRIQAPAA